MIRLTKTPVRLALATALALALSGCASFEFIGKDPTSPRVSVVDGKLSVSAETLRFASSDGPVTITWRLPGRRGLAFAEKLGIVIEDIVPTDDKGSAAARGFAARDVFVCRRTPDVPNEFSCLNRNPGPGKYKYTVRVQADGRDLPALDPYIWNE